MKAIGNNIIACSALILVVGAAIAGCTGSTSPLDDSVKPEPQAPSATPDRLIAQGETELTTLVGTIIQPGPAVRVMDGNDRPLGGVPVTFGPYAEKVVLTDADGIARYGPWQVDTVAGVYFIVASVRVSMQRELLVGFHARANPRPLAKLTALSGNNQVGPPSTTLANQLHARATDIYNNPISGLVVTFSVSGGGALERSTSTTDASGLATVGRWTLGSSGAQRVSARAGDLETLFEATLCTHDPCSGIPVNLAYVRDGVIWISSPEEPHLVANNASRPSWSPDGSRLAFFQLNAKGEDESICIATEPFSAPVCTAIEIISRYLASDMRASWAPDGRTLALSRAYYGPGDAQLFFLDVSTMTIHRHGTIDQMVLSASWSPDGTKLAIATDDKVYLANAGGSELEVVLPYAVWELAWAPDGKKLAVLTLGCDLENCFGVDVALLDPTAKKLTVIERGKNGSSGISWSPDGNRLAYSSGWSSGTPLRNVRIIRIADGASDEILTNASDPSWRP